MVALVYRQFAVALDVMLSQPVRSGKRLVAFETRERAFMDREDVVAERLVLIEGLGTSRVFALEAFGVCDLVALEMLLGIDAFSANQAVKGLIFLFSVRDHVGLEMRLAEKQRPAAFYVAYEGPLVGVGAPVLF